MATIIKNQILKYLSKYFKNLSPDKINFNTIKGEGGLKYLELDEAALTDLLDLPAWMRIKNASCNKVTFHIPWTKLKSEPMVWNLDEVSVEVETCEELRTVSVQDGFPLQSGKYNAINRIVDGMTINVNTVSIKFTSSTFVASLQILRIKVESKSSSWQKCDLRHTKIKDTKRGLLLLFKELTWQIVRIEAQSIIETDLPPLRLLTNEATCRITIKKRLSDCFVLGSKLVLILDDLLWVLTDSQLKAALHFLDSLSVLIKRANEVVRKKQAAKKLEMLPEYQAQVTQQAMMVQSKSAVSKIFSRCDVVETSYHLLAKTIDLHISDDPGPNRSSYPDLQDGGAVHITISRFQVDYYPYHLAVKDRSHWGLYRENRYPHPQWLSQSQSEFKNLLLGLVRDNYSTSSHQFEKAYISQDGGGGVSYHAANWASSDSDGGCTNANNNNQNNNSNQNNASLLRRYLLRQFNKIMTSCVVVRIADFTINRVTTMKNPSPPKEFIKADKERYSLPESEILHSEFTYYYFPGDTQFPVPAPKLYVQVYPIEIQFDVVTVLWFNTFLLNLHKSLLSTSTARNSQALDLNQLFYVDVKLEAIMPRVILQVPEEVEEDDNRNVQKDRPDSLHFEISRITLTNTRSNDTHFSKVDLGELLSACQKRHLFLKTCQFPSASSDFSAIPSKFLDHVRGKDDVREMPNALPISNDDDVTKLLTQDLLWTEAKDVWCIHLESLWGEFWGVRAVGNKPVPFVDAFPVTLWLYLDPLLKNISEQEGVANIHTLGSALNLVSAQVNQYQAIFLAQLLRDLSKVTTFLTVDTDRVIGKQNGSLAVTFLIPQVEVTLVTAPPVATSDENRSKISSSRMDIESSTMADTTSSSLDARSAQWRDSGTTSRGARVKDPILLNDKNDYDDKTERNEEEVGASMSCGKDLRTLEVSSSSKTTEFRLFPQQFKKGITNFMSVDVSLGKSPLVEDVSDTMSIRSDESSDTENYLAKHGGLYEDDGDAMFRLYSSYSFSTKMRHHSVAVATTNVNDDVEIAGDALFDDSLVNETTSAGSDDKGSMNSGGSCTNKRNDSVAALTVKLGPIDFAMQSAGLRSVVKFQVGCIALEECLSIPWHELQSKFSSRTRDWTEIEKSHCQQNEWIKVRFENNVLPPPFVSSEREGRIEAASGKVTNITHWRDAHVRAVLENFSLHVHPLTLKSLAEFAEIEKVGAVDDKPIVLEVLMNNVRIALREELPDEPARSRPMAVSLRKLKVSRDDTGMLIVEPASSNFGGDKSGSSNEAEANSLVSNSYDESTGGGSFSTDAAAVDVQLMKTELQLLRKKLTAMEYLNEENHALRQFREETRILRSCLSAAQEEVSSLLEEKRSLLEYISRSGGGGLPPLPPFADNNDNSTNR